MLLKALKGPSGHIAACGSGYRQRLFDRINIGMSIRRI
ncbi:hypothetical protein C4K19_4660 [Pseudomonas chlororaphis subsp. aurantiaca]|nr:hypothetical protein C4K19_4660 [Pseudomonas chlororaphis subsp. aurantiaca]